MEDIKLFYSKMKNEDVWWSSKIMIAYQDRLHDYNNIAQIINHNAVIPNCDKILRYQDLNHIDPLSITTVATKYTTMKTITPLFPNQESINDAINLLTPEQREKYENLLKQYKDETEKSAPDHEKIGELIKEAQELMMSAM